jgi:tetratricopeptide (TPR) repeat protein
LEQEAQAVYQAKGEAAGAETLFRIALCEMARARFYRRPPRNGLHLDALLRHATQAGGHEPGQDVFLERAFCLRAQLLEGNGQKDEATLVLEKACEALPQSWRILFERGGMALRHGEIELAVEAFERAILVEPQAAYPYHALRFAFEGFRRYRTQRIRFESAIRAQPRDGAAHHQFALAALSVMRDEEALFHFTRALELDPQLAEAACGRARALRRQGHLREAEEAFRQALRIDPECHEARSAIESTPPET